MHDGSIPDGISADIRKLWRALLSADGHLDSTRAYDIARTLCEHGWRHGRGDDGPERPRGGIPAERVRLGTRFILRFTLTGEAASPVEEAASLATHFTREGATVLGMSAERESVELELLASVEQALRVLAGMGDVPTQLLEHWLRDAGYTGDVAARLEQLLRERRDPAPFSSLPLRHGVDGELRRHLN